MLRISAAPIDSGDELKRFEDQVCNAGAIVSFSGQVRAESRHGKVTELYLQAYSPMTENGIEAAMKTAQERWPLDGLIVLHRIGNIASGQTIVFVATASKHRRTAFEAADFFDGLPEDRSSLLEKETTQTGAHWIEPRDADYRDAARWAEKEIV